jgi:acyl-CoA synthetase (AMP-forming)/AMP-acid ligase II
MNIVEPILFHARRQPEAPALCAQGIDVVSYGRLAVQMNTIARRAVSFGLKRGSVVALSFDEALLHAVTILGLTQAGIIPVSVAGHPPPTGLKIDAVISSKPYPFAPKAQHLIFDQSWMQLSRRSEVEISPRGAGASHEVCRIVLTAGTTGDSKAVAFTHRIAMARNARFEFALGTRLPTLSRLFMNMGLAAALGYQFLTYILGRGGTVFFFGNNIEDTLRSFEIFRVQAMLATPATLAQLLTLCDQHPSIDIHLDTILSSGSLLPQSLASRVRPRLCSHLIAGYGSTEAAMSATAAAHRIADIEGAAGYVTPGIRIEIVDDADRPVAAGVEGSVRVASEVGVDRYIDDPLETARVFRDGWFYPGDIGSLTSDNLLIISGRRSDLLNAGGGKMAAEKLENILLSFGGVREAAVFMKTNASGVEEVWATIVCGEKIDDEALRAYCRTRMPAVFVPARIVTVDALPINAAGKVDRPRVRDMFMGQA